jgi:hypothetical protein
MFISGTTNIYGNMDMQVGVEELSDDLVIGGKVYPDKTVFVDRVNISGGFGKTISVFDILGTKVAETKDGVWETHLAPAGVYFLSVDNAYLFKIVKVK